MEQKENKQISYRLFGEKETTTVSQEEFVELLLNEINTKANRK